MINTIDSNEFKIKPDDYSYNYQPELTSKLDSLTNSFTQEIINEIVLWKINRYALIEGDTLDLLNEIDPSANLLDIDLTRSVLTKLLNSKGIQLPMASTILRFKNPTIYQIIDQRVYRILYGEVLNIKYTKSSSNISNQINLYISYLKELREACDKLKIEFSASDRILYMADKRLNGDMKIKY